MKFVKQAFAFAAAALISVATWATPQYNGSTYGEQFDPSSSFGYYIFSDQSRTNWSIRWTGNGADHNPVHWFGSIVFNNSQLGTAEEVRFESRDRLFVLEDFFLLQYRDIVGFRARTNNTGGYDGFDFTINSAIELLTFNLGSSLFADLETNVNDPGVEGSYIHIGENHIVPNVLVFGDRDFQSFEIAVPEPGALALLGLGMVGVIAMRGRKK